MIFVFVGFNLFLYWYEDQVEFGLEVVSIASHFLKATNGIIYVSLF